MLDLGFVSAILPDYNLENVLKFASQHDFKCVELMCWPKDNSEARRYAGVTHIDVDESDPPEVSYINKRTKEFGVSFSGSAPPTCSGETFAESGSPRR